MAEEGRKEGREGGITGSGRISESSSSGDRPTATDERRDTDNVLPRRSEECSDGAKRGNCGSGSSSVDFRISLSGS